MSPQYLNMYTMFLKEECSPGWQTLTEGNQWTEEEDYEALSLADFFEL